MGHMIGCLGSGPGGNLSGTSEPRPHEVSSVPSPLAATPAPAARPRKDRLLRPGSRARGFTQRNLASFPAQEMLEAHCMKLSTFRLNLAMSLSSCCTEISHSSDLPHGGRNTPPLCSNTPSPCPSRPPTPSCPRKSPP